MLKDTVDSPRAVAENTMNEEMTKGQLAQLGAKFLQILPLDADRVEVQKAIEDENDSLWEVVAKRFAKKVAEVAQAVKSVLKGLIDAGKYDYVNPNITEAKFPVPADFVLGSDPKVFHFNCDISSEKAIEEMDKVGYRPAMIWDLLDYGAENPEEQRKFPIVGLGSVGEVGGRRSVPCLGLGVSGRFLNLSWFDRGWRARCRFLGVRKVSQPSVS